MKSRELFKIFAKRYGLGYATIHGSQEVYLLSSYLPDEKNQHPLPALPLPKLFDFKGFENEFSILKINRFCGGLGGKLSHWQGYSDDIFSEINLDKIFDLMDRHFKPLRENTKNSVLESKIVSPIYNACHVGIKNGLSSKVFDNSSMLTYKHENYSLIFNFDNSIALQNFLSYTEKNSDIGRLFGIYECYMHTGCFQILIPRRYQYRALKVLFGTHAILSDLPLVDFLLKVTCNEGNNNCFFQNSDLLTDYQLTFIFNILRLICEFKENLEMENFDEDTQKVISATRGLKKSIQETLDYIKMPGIFLSDKIQMPKGIKNIMQSYLF